MLSLKVTNCRECALVSNLIDSIDCQLAKMANNLYFNIAYMLDKPVEGSKMSTLLHYKRILQYRSVNEDWAPDYCITDIASRVNALTVGCKCCDAKAYSNATTTTTSTTTAAPTTTTTTTEAVPVEYTFTWNLAADTPFDNIVSFNLILFKNGIMQVNETTETPFVPLTRTFPFIEGDIISGVMVTTGSTTGLNTSNKASSVTPDALLIEDFCLDCSTETFITTLPLVVCPANDVEYAYIGAAVIPPVTTTTTTTTEAPIVLTFYTAEFNTDFLTPAFDFTKTALPFTFSLQNGTEFFLPDDPAYLQTALGSETFDTDLVNLLDSQSASLNVSMVYPPTYDWANNLTDKFYKFVVNITDFVNNRLEIRFRNAVHDAAGLDYRYIIQLENDNTVTTSWEFLQVTDWVAIGTAQIYDKDFNPLSNNFANTPLIQFQE
jgi:hypothetical protein